MLPKAGSWLISFFVLAMFWIAHHRLFQRVRVVDIALLWRNLQQLLLVSLLPFSASLLGEFPTTREAQYVYNGHMILLSAFTISQLVHVYRRPEMQGQPFGVGAYHAALLRNVGLIVAGVIAIGIAYVTGSVFATYAYLLMWPLGIVSRRIAARDETRASAPAPSAESGRTP